MRAGLGLRPSFLRLSNTMKRVLSSVTSMRHMVARRRFNGIPQYSERERLLKEWQFVHLCYTRRRTRHHDYFDSGAFRRNGLAEFPTVHPGHCDIRQHQINWAE